MQITCPNCQHKFELDEELSKQKVNEIRKHLEQELQEKIELEKQELNRLAKEFSAKKEAEFALKLKEAEAGIQQQRTLMEEQLKNEMGAKLNFLEQQNVQYEKKVKEAQQTEIQLLQLQNQLKIQEENKAIEIQRALLAKELEIKKELEESAAKRAEEKFVLKIKEYEQKLEQQTKLIDEQKRKMEQGSMEQQGEIQENYVKERLIQLFPFDEITDVAKGKRGADLIHYVRNRNGDLCGTIVYESKNTKNWSNDWKDKLREDVQLQKGDIGVLISQVLPKHIKNIGLDEGVWICGFNEFEGVAAMLRDGIIRVHESKKSQENKGDKMVMLYDYLNSAEFKQKWDAILNGFKSMKDNIEKQRSFYNKTLAEQEQIINGILINGNNFLGSIKGIAGSGMDAVQMLE